MACLARSSLLRLYRPQPALPLVQSTLQVQQIHAQKQRPFSHSTQTPSPQHPNTQSASIQTQANEIETLITTLPLTHSLRQNPLYRESRPHLTIPPSLRATHLVAGSLSGTGMVSVPPFVWMAKPTLSPSGTSTPTSRSSTSSTSSNDNPKQKDKGAKVITIFHLGPNVTGHPGYIHGGLLSIMFDEAFARCVSLSFGSGLGMTANLNVDFRRPALPGRLFVLSAETVGVEGRKAWVKGGLEMLDGGGNGEEVMVAEGRALFIEPRFAEVCLHLRSWVPSANCPVNGPIVQTNITIKFMYFHSYRITINTP